MLIWLPKPKAGTWKIAAAPGSPPLTRILFATEQPPPSIKATVRAATGGRYALRYRVRNYAPGTVIRFSERGRDSTHVIATVRRAGGTVRFTPQAAVARSRRIEANVFGPDGTPGQTSVVGRYRAPALKTAGRPGKVRFVRRGQIGVITWGAAKNARFYSSVLVKGSDGRRTLYRVKAKTRRVRVYEALRYRSFVATVKAEGDPYLRKGPARSACLKAIAKGPPKSPKKAKRLRRLPGTLAG